MRSPTPRNRQEPRQPAAGKVGVDELRQEIIESLLDQGFIIQNGEVSLPRDADKSQLRKLHRVAVEEKLRKARQGLRAHEERLLEWIANGNDVEPSNIRPKLVEVLPRSEEELLFRYAYNHWSIPVSSGYGRRLRFLVIDQHNSKLIGIIGLGDPVFSLKPRDTWIGWDREDRRKRLNHVIDAFVLGAVEPYSQLLFGKLMAMFAVSRDVTDRFAEKYSGRETVILGRKTSGEVAMVTTLSALGRSSVYSRLRDRQGDWLMSSVGMTRGSGEFHFSNGVYSKLADYAREHCKPTAKNGRWGSGFRNRREVVKKVLPSVGLSSEWLYHGVRREVFVGACASNTKRFLRGEEENLKPLDRQAADLFEWFRERWLLPRAKRHPEYRCFDRASYVLWK